MLVWYSLIAPSTFPIANIFIVCVTATAENPSSVTFSGLPSSEGACTAQSLPR